MNAAARNLTAAGLAQSAPILPPRYPHTDRLGDAWRLSVSTLNLCIDMIRDYSAAQHDAYARRALADRLPTYRDALRRVTEFQQEMERLGIAYQRDPNAWADHNAGRM